MFAGAEKMQCSTSVVAELKATQLGLQVVTKNGSANILLASDSLSVNKLNNEGNYVHWNLKWMATLVKKKAAPSTTVVLPQEVTLLLYIFWLLMLNMETVLFRKCSHR